VNKNSGRAKLFSDKPVSISGGAVIAALNCSLPLEHSMMKEKYGVDRRAL
jgi:hypothetical protein